MGRYTIYYVLLLVLGIIIAFMLSSLIHYSLDKPRGVPLARLGLAGTITQIGLMVFPFVFAPIPLGLTFFGRQQRKPTQNECRRLAFNVGLLIFVIWLILFVASGAWFGIIQGGVWLLVGALLGPPLLAAATLWGLFPLAIRSFNMLQSR
ncbi:hypothetical protein [Phycobacter azelaicus]|uniref:hypothetical protein n=1 Tax=Phycobacter azelaicus TaxID=2668075 RepID=UPI001869608D|nr:hypothetical protein [Phycobacter azelaicus]MBE1295569.1 hypothetical protein [Paracoccaceae bacterium]